MTQTVQFKPKALVYISTFLFLALGAIVPFLTYSQTTVFDTRAWVSICLPAIALFPSILAMRKIKTIQINNEEWIVKYLFTGKQISFSKKNVSDTSAAQHVMYKFGIPYTAWKIVLRSGQKIQFSSMELKNSHQIVRHFKKLKN
jgi:hypothetical protein